MRCHLEETSLKESFANNQREQEYLMRIRHPDNPFSAEPSECISFSKELGRLTTDLIEMPRTVFHYIRRSNRTNRRNQAINATQEDANARAVDIMESADPTTLVKKPQTRLEMAEYVTSYLTQMRSSQMCSQ